VTCYRYLLLGMAIAHVAHANGLILDSKLLRQWPKGFGWLEANHQQYA